MKITLNWIRDYVDAGLDADALVRHFIQIGFDIEEVAASGDDAVLTVDVPSNRPDALGVIGLARELAARLRKPLKVPDVSLRDSGAPVQKEFQVEVEAAADCPRYTARLLRGVRVAPSPDWLRDRLLAVGLTPVNNVVDVTNFVLYECGQPLHAFDAARLKGRRIVVRRGRPAEKMEAINGRMCDCGPDTLVIADGGGPVALAGVMGGKATEISEATRDVLLESAQFDPVVIRRGARRMALESDSSYRFERGVSYEGVAWASQRAASLIVQVAGGGVAPGVVDVAPGKPPRRAVPFRLDRCERVLGVACEAAAVGDVLAAIGCRLAGEPRRGAPVEVEIPEYRRDLQREEDLVEEVARHLGYDRIPTTPQIPLAVTEKDRQGMVEARLRERLVALGYQETLTLSFSDAEHADLYRLDEAARPVIVLGKHGTPDRPLRMAVVSSLLDVLRTNARYGVGLPQAFEIAAAYGMTAGAGIVERQDLGMVLRGGFRELRGHLESVAASVGLPLLVAPCGKPPASWPAGRTASLMLDGKAVGAVAELPADALARHDLQNEVCIAEIDLAAWFEKASLRIPYREFSRQPDVLRDLAVVVEEGVSWGRIADVVRSAAPPWMERLEAFDVFRGAQIPPGRKSVAFSMSFRREDRTLTRPEVDAAIDGIVRRLAQDVGASLR
jgi:phenylalanyl-tRNA synthetase beta chain